MVIIFVHRSGLTSEDFAARLELIMTARETHWPDPQIKAQGHCEGEPGPFAKYEECLSSIFVTAGDKYGTRTTTSVVVDSSGVVHFKEVTWQGNGLAQFSLCTLGLDVKISELQPMD